MKKCMIGKRYGSLVVIEKVKKYKEQLKYPERFSKEVGGNIVAEPFKPKSKDYER